jgi:hypothetical protein
MNYVLEKLALIILLGTTLALPVAQSATLEDPQPPRFGGPGGPSPGGPGPGRPAPGPSRPSEPIRPVNPPSNPGYNRPVNPGYGRPTNPGYERPTNPGYGRPMPPSYGRPERPPQYGRPERPPTYPGYEQGRPGWNEGWRWDYGYRRPSWCHDSIDYPQFEWVYQIAPGYYQCTSFNNNLYGFSAIGATIDEAAYNALYDCGGPYYLQSGCYIPNGYCQYYP